MIDAFGGACVYDESSRFDAGGKGVLTGCSLDRTRECFPVWTTTFSAAG